MSFFRKSAQYGRSFLSLNSTGNQWNPNNMRQFVPLSSTTRSNTNQHMTSQQSFLQQISKCQASNTMCCDENQPMTVLNPTLPAESHNAHPTVYGSVHTQTRATDAHRHDPTKTAIRQETRYGYTHNRLRIFTDAVLKLQLRKLYHLIPKLMDITQREKLWNHKSNNTQIQNVCLIETSGEFPCGSDMIQSKFIGNGRCNVEYDRSQDIVYFTPIHDRQFQRINIKFFMTNTAQKQLVVSSANSTDTVVVGRHNIDCVTSLAPLFRKYLNAKSCEGIGKYHEYIEAYPRNHYGLTVDASEQALYSPDCQILERKEKENWNGRNRCPHCASKKAVISRSLKRAEQDSLSPNKKPHSTLTQKEAVDR
eukprot:100075_1